MQCKKNLKLGHCAVKNACDAKMCMSLGRFLFTIGLFIFRENFIFITSKNMMYACNANLCIKNLHK